MPRRGYLGFAAFAPSERKIFDLGLLPSVPARVVFELVEVSKDLVVYGEEFPLDVVPLGRPSKLPVSTEPAVFAEKGAASHLVWKVQYIRNVPVIRDHRVFLFRRSGAKKARAVSAEARMSAADVADFRMCAIPVK